MSGSDGVTLTGKLSKLGCGGLYLLFLLGCGLYCWGWQADMVSLREGVRSQRAARHAHALATEPLRAELVARAGLARVLAVTKLRLASGEGPRPQDLETLGESHPGGYDGYTATVSRDGEHYAITIESEVAGPGVDEYGDPSFFETQVLGSCTLVAKAKITAQGFDVLEQTVTDTTPAQPAPADPFR